MARVLKLGAAVDRLVYEMRDPATGEGVTSDVSPTSRILRATAISWAGPSGATTFLGNGKYAIAPHVADRDTLGELTVRGDADGYVCVPGEYEVWAEVPPNQASATLSPTVCGYLDAAVTSRMATYTQPAGFLAATFPSDPADQSLVIAATDAIMSRIGSGGANLTAIGDKRLAGMWFLRGTTTGFVSGACTVTVHAAPTITSPGTESFVIILDSNGNPTSSVYTPPA